MIQLTSPLRRSASALALATAPEAFRDDTWVGTLRAGVPARGPKPPLLLVAPGAEDPSGMRALVQSGAPHPRADLLQRVTGGAPLTATGLEALYRRAVPALQWQVQRLRTLLPNTIAFTLVGTVPRRRWYQRRPRPKPVYHCEKRLIRHADGALELHACGMFLHPRLRGRGLVARCETVESQLLRSLSAHPDTRLSLAAGFALNPFILRPAPEHGGYYAHGAHHYLFADEAGMEFPSWLYGWDKQPSDGLQLWTFFSHWFEVAARRGTLRQADGRRLTAEAQAALARRIDACRTPHDFAMLRVPGVKVNGQAALGKACLTSGAAPPWAGVRFVNPARGDSPQAAARQRSAWGFAARALQEMSRPG